MLLSFNFAESHKLPYSSERHGYSIVVVLYSWVILISVIAYVIGYVRNRKVAPPNWLKFVKAKVIKTLFKYIFLLRSSSVTESEEDKINTEFSTEWNNLAHICNSIFLLA